MSNVKFTNKAYLRNYSRRHARLYEALEFYLKKLRCYSLVKDVVIKLRFVNQGADGWIASCQPTKQIVYKSNKKAKKIEEITIVINTHEEISPSAQSMYLALAHECVHLKQYIKNQLFYSYENGNGPTEAIVWKGEARKEKQWSAFYACTPWEKEAHAKEKMLMEAFVASIR